MLFLQPYLISKLVLIYLIDSRVIFTTIKFFLNLFIFILTLSLLERPKAAIRFVPALKIHIVLNIWWICLISTQIETDGYCNLCSHGNAKNRPIYWKKIHSELAVHLKLAIFHCFQNDKNHSFSVGDFSSNSGFYFKISQSCWNLALVGSTFCIW